MAAFLIMKLKLKCSVKSKVDGMIDDYGSDNIDSIQLNYYEYIQFLEEISPSERIILSLPERIYKKVQLEVIPK